MPRWRVMKLKSCCLPSAASLALSLSSKSERICLMRWRIVASSCSHCARSAGVSSTVATTCAPWVGGLL